MRFMVWGKSVRRSSFWKLTMSGTGSLYRPISRKRAAAAVSGSMNRAGSVCIEYLLSCSIGRVTKAFSVRLITSTLCWL